MTNYNELVLAIARAALTRYPGKNDSAHIRGDFICDEVDLSVSTKNGMDMVRANSGSYDESAVDGEDIILRRSEAHAALEMDVLARIMFNPNGEA